MRYINKIFNKWLIALFVVGSAMTGNNLYAQIKVLNIPDGSAVRGYSSNGRAQPMVSSYTYQGTTYSWRESFGYHLDGRRTQVEAIPNGAGGYTYYYSIADMQRAKAKLTNTANFGPSGTVPYTLNITSAYGVRGSITNISMIDDYDIIFIGLYDRRNASNTAAFTPEEIAILEEWSAKPGKVLLVMEQAVNSTVSTEMGYTIVNGSNTNPTTALPYDEQLGINIFSGVFGNSTGISQNGHSQGYFNSNCGGLPLGNNVNGKSTIIFNRKYRDLYFADTGFFTRLNNSTATGQLSSGGAITNAADRAWANTWAWAVSEVVNNVDPGYTTSGGVAYTNQALPLLTGTDAVISLKDNTEQIIRWETSTDGGATWTTISSTSLTITYPNPQDGQQFRAVTGNLPECEETISEPVVITVGLPDPCAVLSVDLQPYNGQTNTAQIFADNVIGIGSARMTISHPFGSERLTTDRIYESLGVDGLNYRHAGAANSFDDRIETQISFSTPVKDLSFVINDLDQGDRLRVLAYDQNNVLIPLTSANYEFYPNTIVTYNPGEGVTGEFLSTDDEIADTRGTINFNFNGKQVSRVLFQYYDILGGGIYIITNFSGIDGTDCPDCTDSGITSVNLNSLFTGTLPHPDVVLEWWTTPTRDLDPLNPGTKVDDPTNVTESGTYYVFFYDTVNDCYNTDNSTSFVNVNILPPCDINTCVTGDCNPNTFINAVDPNTLEYDNMVSVFHSSMVREADGTIRIWGQGAMPNGYSNGSSTGSVGNVLTPIEVSPANGYNYSGKILRFTAGSNQYNQQFAILTTDGLYSWGDQGVLLHADLQPRGVFTKLEVGTYGIAGTKADGLPDGVNPEDVKMLFGMRNGMAIVTCTGEAWVLSNITQLYGDGITSSSENKVWHRVSTAADTPLENVVAIRGAYRNMVALTASGELYTWGGSTLLGDGTASATRTYATLMTKPAGVTPKMIGMTRSASSAGDEMSYYLLATDGRLYSMGANDKRQLGNGTTTRTTTWGEVTATDATTGATLGGNIVWLSPQEHDGNQDYPAVSVLTDQGKLWAWGTNDGNMLGIPGGGAAGNDPTYMPGRTTGAYDETKLNESDEVIAVETGGHTSIIIKKCTIKFGYVGHRINGSMADGTTVPANEGIYNFSETSQLAVCGALTSPKIPELLEICPDEVQDLTAVQTILPAEVTGIHWYHDMNATVPVSNPSAIGPGTYYAFYELAGGTIHDCPSRLVVSYYAANDPNSPCYCVEPGIPGEPDGYTLTGVSDLVGFNEGWPNNVPNGFIAIESKTQGFVITRVAHVGGTDGTPDASDAISNPVEGMLVYDIQDACVKLFNGTTWNCLDKTCNDIFRIECDDVTIDGNTNAPNVDFTITVGYSGGDGSAYAAQTIESINVPGLNATLEAGNLENGDGTFVLTVAGNTSHVGKIYFELNINGQTCVLEAELFLF